MKPLTTYGAYSFLLLIVVVISVLAGCNPKPNQEAVKAGKYKLEVVDSVSLNRLSTLILLDYQESTEELLLFDTQLREILLVDQYGKTLSTFKPFIEGPNYMGDESFGWNFYGDDKILGFGRNYFYIFSKQGKRLDRYTYPTEATSWWLLDYNPKMIFTYPGADQIETLAIITGAITPKYKTQAYQDSAQIIYSMNFATGESKPVFNKPPHSIYRTIGAYIDRGWPLIMNLKKSQFAMTYHADSNIYILDASMDSILKTIPIPKAYQPVYETVPFEDKGKPDLSRINASLISTGDHLILKNYDIVPESVMRKIKLTEKGQWWESDAYKEATKKYFKTRTLLFDSNYFLGEIAWDLGGINYDIISTESGFFWVQRRYKDERDYRTFLKISIAEVE
jgi:hypothetical protein